jgi:low temperature requirement protein LtrA
VYVIAISRITHLFAAHPGAAGLLDYSYLFIMIFWGWLNGSIYHDLHGSPGIRTRLMTLWQMMAVAALIVCLDSPQDGMLFRTTIALMVLQLFITYLWWSVAFTTKRIGFITSLIPCVS